ncbi:MAG: carboxypeptidase-like regulatory domain-containing protein [Elusimicrobiota bacterium]
MRTRSRHEIMRGYAALHKEQSRRRRRPFQIAAAVILLGVSGKLFMLYSDTFMAAVNSAISRTIRWTDDIRNPSNYTARQAQSAFPAAAPGSSVSPETAMQMHRAANTPPAGGPAPAASNPPARPSRPAPLAKNSWRVSGTVYDLATLTPVRGAVITFLRDSKQPATVATDDHGTYRIDLAKSDGWTVSLKTPGHRRGQILDIDPSYRVRDADERRAVFEHIAEEDLAPAPVVWKRATSEVKLDLITLPLKWADTR